MKSFSSLALLPAALFMAWLFSLHQDAVKKVPGDFYAPSEWAGIIRNYPDTAPRTDLYLTALRQSREDASLFRSASSFNTAWLQEGPGNIGGRFNCLAADPQSSQTFYAGSASGGIWKTTDNCLTWLPVFDEFTYLSVSDIKVRPGNSDVVYAATGDENISGYVFVGDGVYRSYDAGATWSNIGLNNTGIVCELVLHPTDTSVMYAATMGYPFNPDPNRGVYKTNDGGMTWNKVLFVNDSAGVIDLVMDPFNPDVLYAASWNRIRNNTRSLVSGPDAKIWKTTDAGLTWTPLSNGLPQGNLSRIGLAVSGVTPGRLFAVIVNDQLDLEGVFRSDDSGSSWAPVNTSGIASGAMGGFGWYFGKLVVNPVDDDEIFVCAVDMWKTADNGSTWSGAWWTSDPHADKHDIIHLGGNNWLMATDGGIYRTNDDGITWNDADNIPNNQFYRITYNPHSTNVFAGGVQDNGTTSGNAASINNWNRIYGGDGFTILYHPSDPNILFAEYQNGGIVYSDDGGFSFFDATTGIDPSDRRNWDMPYVFNPQNADEMLTGTYQAYINSFGINVFWQTDGTDLTDGVIFGDRFHTVSAVDWSPLNSNHLLAGTSDGNVWFSSNKGNSWNAINAGIPDRYITSLHFSPNTANRIYCTVSGYKDGLNQPHIFRSDNNGTAWVNISSNLPPLAVNDVYIMPGNDSILFVATDGGVYGTTNGGSSWLRTGNNMPFVPVYDIDFDPVTRKLLAGSFGRSMYSVNVDTLLSTQGVQVLSLKDQLKVYPTIFNESIRIYNTLGEFQVRIFSLNGELVAARSISKGMNVLHLEELNAGAYLLRVEGGQKQGAWKILKQ